MRRAGKPERSYPIRVTGGEVPQPTAAVPAPNSTHRQPVEAPEPLVPNTDSVEALEAARPAVSGSAAEFFRSSRPLSPRRERDASNTFRTIAQSSSVIRVSMVGLQIPTAHESQILWFGNPITLCSTESVHTA